MIRSLWATFNPHYQKNKWHGSGLSALFLESYTVLHWIAFILINYTNKAAEKCINCALWCPLILNVTQHTTIHSSFVSRWQNAAWPSEKVALKKCPDVTVDSSGVLCSFCSKQYHRSMSSLKYHLSAKHLVTSSEVRPSTAPDATVSNQYHRATLAQAFRRRLSKSACDRLYMRLISMN